MVDDNTRDDTKEFLQRLDTVLSELVEIEKEKISKYGSVEDTERHTQYQAVSAPQRKKLVRQKKIRKVEEEDEEGVSPSMRHLRATLRTVRVRKRVPAEDVLDQHAHSFTAGVAHRPRILKSHYQSKLLGERCYQPPRHRRQRLQPSANLPPSNLSISGGEDERDATQAEAPAESDSSYNDDSRDEFEDEDDSYHPVLAHNSPGVSPSPPAHHPQPRPPLTRPPEDEVQMPQRGFDPTDSGDFSVDSAYTGSRGATPDLALYPGVKPRRLGGSLNTSLTSTQTPKPARHQFQPHLFHDLKRTILREIREKCLYTDDSINTLLDQHRRRLCHVSPADLDFVTRSIQEDLGVKPRPVQYLHQILDATESFLPCKDESVSRAGTGEPSLSSGSSRDPHLKQQGRTATLGAKTAVLGACQTPEQAAEEEDEAWLREALAGAAPQLVTEARREAQQRADDEADPEWSRVVSDLCQQFDIDI